MKNLKLSVGLTAAAFFASADIVNAADMDAMVTKAPMMAPVGVTPPTACGSINDFFLTSCPLSWYGVTFYGTVDLGGTYATHGTPFDPNHPTGELYAVGAGGTVADNRLSGFFLGENAMSQSNVGMKTNIAIAPGWNFVSVNELAFNPYSLLLANAPQAEFNAIGVPQNQWEVPYDSSRWGWLAAQNFVGFSSPTWGTLTFGRQNAPMTDGVNAYDAFGGAYAFGVIGYSGKTCGAGDTEECRWTTAIKYRFSMPTIFGSFRAVVMGQPIGGSSGGYNSYNANNGAIQGGIGGDIKQFGPGVLSVDLLGAWERDAVNWQLTGTAADYVLGVPLATFPANTYLKATLSNNTSFMALAKYSLGSWQQQPAPMAGKAPIAPSGPTGIPLTLYAGYEWIQYSNPSDSQTSFRDDGFLLTNAGLSAAAATAASAGSPVNGTAIANNAFNALCGSGGGCTNEIFQVMWAGLKYGITRDLDIIGSWNHYIQNQYVIATSAATCANNGAANARCAGSYSTYAVAFDWRFLPKWDTYIGLMYSAAYGGIAFGDIQSNNLAVTAGVRFRF
jgi:predicted porin